MKSNPRSYPVMLVTAFVIAVACFIGFIIPAFGMLSSVQPVVGHDILSRTGGWFFLVLLLTVAVFLYRLLKSQERFQREQVSLNKLFAHTIRSGHHADFELVDDIESLNSELEKLKSLRFRLQKNDAFDVHISCDWKHSVSEDYYLQKTKTGYQSSIARLYRDTEFSVEIADQRFPDLSEFKSAQAAVAENAPHIECYRLKFHFNDAFGLPYSKVFILSYSPTERKFYHISSGVEHL